MQLCKDLNQINTVAQAVIDALPNGGVVVLQGDLASGKTTLVKAIAQQLGVTHSVTSPTFSICQEYDNTLFHYDIYNHGLGQFLALGLFETLQEKGVHCIEWGDKALIELLVHAQIKTVVVAITKEQNQRCYRIEHAA